MTKITYLELLERVRDGKQPDKVKYENNIYHYHLDGYFMISNGITHYLSRDILIYKREQHLITEKCIGIIEESNKIEKLELFNENVTLSMEEFITTFNNMATVINAMVDKLNSMEKEGER